MFEEVGLAVEVCVGVGVGGGVEVGVPEVVALELSLVLEVPVGSKEGRGGREWEASEEADKDAVVDVDCEGLKEKLTF